MNDSPSILPDLLFILVLVLINAFFAASEMAIVSINKNKITRMAEDEDNSKAKLLLKLTNEPSKFLATIQVGITVAGFLASASAATKLSAPLTKILNNLNIPGSPNIALIIVTILLSYITLVFGELLPKRIALQNSENIALSVVKPIVYFSKAALPFVKILTFSTSVLGRLFGINSDNIEEDVSVEEIKMMIEVGQETGVINETEKEMINGIFDFDDTLAKEIMTPRTNVFAVDLTAPTEDVLDKILEEKYSRVPVYEEDVDNIIGILYVKDLFFGLRHNKFLAEDLTKLLRPAYFVPETKPIDVLFKEMQKDKTYMTILIDEYGGFSGIVTMEDLLEEIVGNIFDEYDEMHMSITKIDPNTYMIDGLLSIDEINEVFHLNLPTDNADTIGGFVVNLLGAMPNDNEIVEYENITFKIEKAEDKRIKTLKITIS
ncbi:MAG: HlyC/CorC family transporter [Clostridium lundense]|nr:HlyC/CorC family transporter [Clostridium lundense]